MLNLQQYKRDQEFEIFEKHILKGIEPYYLAPVLLEWRESSMSYDLWTIRVTLDWLVIRVIPDVGEAERLGFSNSDWMYYIADEVIKQFWAMSAEPVNDNIILGEY